MVPIKGPKANPIAVDISTQATIKLILVGKEIVNIEYEVVSTILVPIPCKILIRIKIITKTYWFCVNIFKKNPKKERDTMISPHLHILRLPNTH